MSEEMLREPAGQQTRVVLDRFDDDTACSSSRLDPDLDAAHGGAVAVERLTSFLARPARVS